MNPPIPLVMRIVILFDWRMEFSLCLIGPKNSYPKLNWMAIYSQFSLALERGGGHRLEQRISSFHWTRETSSRKVMKAYQGRRYYVYVGRKGRGGGSVRKNV